MGRKAHVDFPALEYNGSITLVTFLEGYGGSPMIFLIPRWFGKFVACAVCTALILTAPGLQGYRAVAQTLGVGGGVAASGNVPSLLPMPAGPGSLENPDIDLSVYTFELGLPLEDLLALENLAEGSFPAFERHTTQIQGRETLFTNTQLPKDAKQEQTLASLNRLQNARKDWESGKVGRWEAIGHVFDFSGPWQGKPFVKAALLGLHQATPSLGLSLKGEDETNPRLHRDEGESLAKSLKSHIVKLAQEIGERNFVQYENLEQASRTIEKTFRSYGYTPQPQTYQAQGKEFRNWIAEKKGSNPDAPTLILGAHYDTARGTPGADDNASGVAVLLETARLLRNVPTENTVRFVAFSTEEPPFFNTNDMGSAHYAKALRKKGERVGGMVSLEMLGYYSDEEGSQKHPPNLEGRYPTKGNFIALVGDLRSQNFLKGLERHFRKNSEFPLVTASFPSHLVPNIASSDHRSFWEVGYPALMLTDTAFLRNPHYHQKTDTIDRIDYRRLALLTQGLYDTVRDWAQTSASNTLVPKARPLAQPILGLNAVSDNEPPNLSSAKPSDEPLFMEPGDPKSVSPYLAPKPPSNMKGLQNRPWKALQQGMREITAGRGAEAVALARRYRRRFRKAERRLGDRDAYTDLFGRVRRANEHPQGLMEWYSRPSSYRSKVTEDEPERNDYMATPFHKTVTVEIKQQQAMVAMAPSRADGSSPMVVYFRRWLDDSGLASNVPFSVSHGHHYFLVIKDSRQAARLHALLRKVGPFEEAIPDELETLLRQGVVESALVLHKSRLHSVWGWPGYSTLLEGNGVRYSSYGRGDYYDEKIQETIATLWTSRMSALFGDVPATPSPPRSREDEAYFFWGYIAMVTIGMVAGAFLTYWLELPAYAVLGVFIYFAFLPKQSSPGKSLFHGLFLSLATGGVIYLFITLFIPWALGTLTSP